MLYWSIGKDILTQQKQHGWGAKIIDQLAADLRNIFPGMTGFSSRNLKYMRAFAEAWPNEQIVQQLATQIPWFHNCVILDRAKGPHEREWYIRQTIQNGWSRNVLVHQIESGLYLRQGKALTNSIRTLPAPQSALAQQVVKDPYNLEFLTLAEEARERELERALIDHIRDFLWNSESALRSSAASIRSKWAARSFESIFCSTTCACAVRGAGPLMWPATFEVCGVRFMWRSAPGGRFCYGTDGTKRHISNRLRQPAEIASSFGRLAKGVPSWLSGLRKGPRRLGFHFEANSLRTLCLFPLVNNYTAA